MDQVDHYWRLFELFIIYIQQDSDYNQIVYFFRLVSKHNGVVVFQLNKFTVI